MTDVECQRRLRKLAALERNAGGFAAKRMPAVGADDEARRFRSTARQLNRDEIVAGADGNGVIVQPREVGDRSGALLQRRHQNVVRNIISKRIETDFVAGKLDLRRTDQAPGVIDQPHGQKFGRLVLTVRPYVQRSQEIDRGAEQGGRPVVGIGRAPGNQYCARARLRDRNRGGQPGRSRTHHGNVINRGILVHAGHLTSPATFSRPLGRAWSFASRTSDSAHQMCKSNNS